MPLTVDELFEFERWGKRQLELHKPFNMAIAECFQQLVTLIEKQNERISELERKVFALEEKPRRAD